MKSSTPQHCHVFFLVPVIQTQWVSSLFYDVGKKVCFILFCGFCNFGRCKLE
jgi:hypothetical protein